MSGYDTRCEDCGPRCEVCERTAYCWSEQTAPPCNHDRPLCEEHRLDPRQGCPDCRREAEREMYRTGVYSREADPFIDHTVPEPEDPIARDGGYWWGGSWVSVPEKDKNA